MKKPLLIISFLLFYFMIYSQENNRLEVYYFHITNRCKTCISIENNTKKTLETYFKKEIKDGKIKLITLNVDEEKNKKISEKYGAYGSALFLTKISAKKETITDMTNFAFQNSLSRAEKFIIGLKSKIEENLKN